MSTYINQQAAQARITERIHVAEQYSLVRQARRARRALRAAND